MAGCTGHMYECAGYINVDGCSGIVADCTGNTKSVISILEYWLVFC